MLPYYSMNIKTFFGIASSGFFAAATPLLE
jgi:hypothetical protein